MADTSQRSSERDTRDLNRGLAVNLLGYVLKIAQPALLIWVVRSYGAEAWGQYTISEAVLLVAVRVILLGFDKTLLWWVPRMSLDEHALARFRGALYGTVGLALIASVAIGTVLAPPLAEWRGHAEAAGALRWMAWSLVPMSAMELFIAGALGKRRLESHVLVRDALVPGSFVVLALAAYFADATALGLSVAHLVANTIGALAAGTLFVKLYGLSSLFGRAMRPSSELVRYTLPAWGTELVNSVAQRLDVFAVSYFGSPAAAGVYGVVVRVGNAVRSVRRSYDPIVTTIMSDIAVSPDRARLRPAFSHATVLVMLTQTPIFVGLALFADKLMLLFGADFSAAAVPVLVLCTFWLINGAIGLNGLIVNGFGRSDLILYDLLISTVIQAILLAILVPRYGPVGAAFAVGAGYVTANLIQVVQAWMLSGINPYNRQVAVAAVASIAAIVAGGATLWITRDFAYIYNRVSAAAVFLLVLFALVRFRGQRLQTST